MRYLFVSLFIAFLPSIAFSQQGFVQQHDGRMVLDGKPYRYIGTNYWYGSLLALQKDTARGVGRLRKELDFLKNQGVTNLRVMAGAEGSGMIAGVNRVAPPLQPAKNIFDTAVLYGLDVLLDEMRKRDMKAVIFFSNNWEWSGGFLQYLNWNGIISDSVLRAKMNWDDMRDHISKFYSCEPCMTDYRQQVTVVMSRVNSVNGIRYIDDSTIMSWELANEPRPMRPAANKAYRQWISKTAAFIRSKDQHHLICLGHEGEIGTQSMELFETIHADTNINYLTIHIWPKNWGWMKTETMQQDFYNAATITGDYIEKHIGIAKTLSKPLVIEEFGFPRDNMQFTPASSTQLRNKYYDFVFTLLKRHDIYLAGINFWSFNGTARPIANQVFWKPGDDYMGDPPMEQQSLYGVFDNDKSTWKIIRKHIKFLKK